jgi:hypothetical protein
MGPLKEPKAFRTAFLDASRPSPSGHLAGGEAAPHPFARFLGAQILAVPLAFLPPTRWLGGDSCLWMTCLIIFGVLLCLLLSLTQRRVRQQRSQEAEPFPVAPPEQVKRLLDHQNGKLFIRSPGAAMLIRGPLAEREGFPGNKAGGPDLLIRTTGNAVAVRHPEGWRCFQVEETAVTELREGDMILLEEDQTVPADGEVLEGFARVDESAVTGETSSVCREAGTVQSAVVRGSRILPGRLLVRVSGAEAYALPAP